MRSDDDRDQLAVEAANEIVHRLSIHRRGSRVRNDATDRRQSDRQSPLSLPFDTKAVSDCLMP